MIYVRLSGRFGNYLFQIAAGASLAKRLGVEYKVLVAPDSEPICTTSSQTMRDYLSKFKDTVFRQIEFVREAPAGARYYSWREFAYKPFPFDGSEDVIIDGYFQSYLYIDEALVRRLYAMPDEIAQSLHQKYDAWIDTPYVCIHVRRGDYLHLPHRFSICSNRFFRLAMRQFPADTRFVIISDDMPWCKRHLKGEHVFYADQHPTLLEDFYLQTLAVGNVISNSSFSWWGAYLNAHASKRVFYPVPWFGPHNAHHDTSQLCPTSWVALPNRTPFRYWLKSVYIRLKMKF